MACGVLRTFRVIFALILYIFTEKEPPHRVWKVKNVLQALEKNCISINRILLE